MIDMNMVTDPNSNPNSHNKRAIDLLRKLFPKESF